MKRIKSNKRKKLLKSKNVNIRMSESDWSKLKTKAAKNGLPYQTLMSAILHQYANGILEVGL
jgi:predicted DNA binding CopG/RHH family protein